jgi:hypothetical protein
MWFSVFLGLLVVLRVVQSNVLDDWEHMLVVDTACPRYLAFTNRNDGLGDQLERFYLTLALAYKYRDFNVTVIAPDNFGEGSIHYNSYASIVRNVLGFPTQRLIRFTQFLNGGYKYTKTNRWTGREERLYNLEQLTDYLSPNLSAHTVPNKFIEHYPCYNYHEVDIVDSCGKWCPLFIGDEIWKAVHTLVEQTYVAHGSRCHAYTPQDVLSFLGNHSIINGEENAKAITFMVHLRYKSNSHDSFSDELCHHCKDTYLKALWNTIESIANAQQRPFKVVVIHRKPHENIERTPNFIKFLDQYPQQVVYYTEDKLEQVICMFAQADVLITTGSTLPSMISWSFPLHRPILIEERRLLKEKEFEQKKILHHHVTSTERAFHIVNGVLINNEDNGAIKRISALLSKKYNE